MGNKDLIQQMKGRAKFCRDRGEIKTPELLERASNLLESQETEELLAAEAEIARLQSALDDLKKTCNDVLDLGVSDGFEQGWGCAHRRVLCRIEAIIGADK